MTVITVCIFEHVQWRWALNDRLALGYFAGWHALGGEAGPCGAMFPGGCECTDVAELYVDCGSAWGAAFLLVVGTGARDTMRLGFSGSPSHKILEFSIHAPDARFRKLQTPRRASPQPLMGLASLKLDIDIFCSFLCSVLRLNAILG
jgi:hypothetical protein